VNEPRRDYRRGGQEPSSRRGVGKDAISQAQGVSYMKNSFVIAAACALLACPALAATVAEKTGINSTLGIAPTTADFVQEAAISDMFEIQSSKLAETKLTGADKDFADEMIADHTKTSTELEDQAKADNIPVPADMDSSHKMLLDKLNTLNGNDFKKQYFSDQVSGHKDAVSLFQRYAKGGDNTKLKNWASTTLPTLQHHLDMALNLDKNS
jgi:putative membrane protein